MRKQSGNMNGEQYLEKGSWPKKGLKVRTHRSHLANLFWQFCCCPLTVGLVLTCSVAFARPARSHVPDGNSYALQTGRDDGPTLVLGKEVRRELTGDQVQSFPITLEANQFVKITVVTPDIDLLVALVAKDGTVLRERANANHLLGEATVQWVAETGGSYRVKIRKAEVQQRGGSYVTKLVALRPAGPPDKSLVAGENAFDAGLKLLSKGTPDIAGPAFINFRKAVSHFHDAGDAALEAQAMRRQAFVHVMQGEADTARQLDEDALRLLEQTFGLQSIKVVPALWDLADVMLRSGQSSEARGKLERAQKIIQSTLGIETLPGALGLGIMGNALMSLGEPDAAFEAKLHASKILEQRYGPDSIQVADSYAALSNILHNQLKNYQAYEYLERALRNYEKRFGPNGAENLNLLFSLVHVLQNLNRRTEALEKTEHALRIIKQKFGPESPQAAEATGRKGDLLSSLDRLAEARAAYEEVFRISPPRSPAKANALLRIARGYVEEHDYERARLKFDELIRFTEGQYGAGSPEITIALRAKLDAYPAPGDYPAGRALYEKALQISERLNPEVLGTTLTSAADFDLAHGKKDEAAAKYERAVAIWVKEGSPHYLMRAADLLQDWGEKMTEGAGGDEAVTVLQRSVEMHEKVYGPNHPALVGPLNSLARAFMYGSQFDKARLTLERSRAVLDTNKQNGEPIAAKTLGRLAGLLSLVGKFEASAKASQQALEIYEKAGSQRLHSDEEIALRNALTESLIVMGEFPKARRIAEGTISISRQLPGPPPIGVLLAKGFLALLLIAQGDTKSALPYLDDMKANLGSPANRDDLESIVYLHLAANAFVMAGRSSEAAEFARKAAAHAVAAFPTNSPITSRLQAHLALLLMTLGEYAEAEAISTASDKQLGESAPELVRAWALIVKGERLVHQGKKAEGISEMEAAVKMVERERGPRSFMLAGGYNRIGWLTYSQKNLPQTREWFFKAAEATDNHLRNVLPLLSLAEQRIFLDETVPQQISALLTSCREGSEFGKAYELIFRWKGSLIDSLRREALIARLGRRANDSGDADPLESQRRERIKKLSDVRLAIAGWYRNSSSATAEEWKTKNDALTQEKERLERQIAQETKTGELDDPLADGLKAFQSQLRSDEVFIDVYQYQHQTFEGAESERYAAVIIPPTGTPVLVDLGGRKGINNAVQAWRHQVLNKLVTPAKEWGVLVALLWKPLVEGLPSGTRKIWMSPDGELARLPWQLLPSSTPKSKDFLLTLADSAREFSRLRGTRVTSTPGAKAILLVGDIDFEAKLVADPVRVKEKGFDALDGTLTEIQRIAAMWKKSNGETILLTGARADKKGVTANLQKVNYAHLATHGFFAREVREIIPSIKTAWTPLLDSGTLVNSRNPLVESGIALAGANMVDQITFESTGLFSAEEIIGLDLSQCELVTLSACETGRGEEVAGQGVMGLRASVMTAGSRSMLMSLWRVPNDATEKFMRAFYNNLWEKKMTKAEALLQAQNAVRDDPSGAYRLPFNWSGWVMVGEGW